MPACCVANVARFSGLRREVYRIPVQRGGYKRSPVTRKRTSIRGIDCRDPEPLKTTEFSRVWFWGFDAQLGCLRGVDRIHVGYTGENSPNNGPTRACAALIVWLDHQDLPRSTRQAFNCDGLESHFRSTISNPNCTTNASNAAGMAPSRIMLVSFSLIPVTMGCP